MSIKFTRCPQNPVIQPGLFEWRMATVFNPGVLYEDGKFYLYERTAGQLRPFHCYIGMLESDDGINFKHVSDEPVFTPEMAGSKYGSVQDPRVVKIADTYYMTYAYRPYAWNSHPTGLGVPESVEAEFPGFSGKSEDNQTRSGIAISKDRINWKHHCWPTPVELDDRDVILFPEKINGRFALLRRPLQHVSPSSSKGQAAIWISYSEDLECWTDPELIIGPEQKWEGAKIGGSTPPIKTEQGWLVLYHGVEEEDPSVRRVVYRMGVMMLDLEDPTKVIARCPNYIMEPEAYYEKFGLYIPNVIFPTGAVVKEDLLYLYYGAADTAIGLATVPFSALVDYVMEWKL